MSTLSPSELFLRWTQEDLTAEQALGQVLQIIISQQQQLQETRQRVRALEEQRTAQAPPAPATPQANPPKKRN